MYGFYAWLHALLTSLIHVAGGAGEEFAAYAAHALLGMQRPDLPKQLERAQGISATTCVARNECLCSS